MACSSQSMESLRRGTFIVLYLIVFYYYLFRPLGFNIQEMLVLCFLEMSLMLILFLTGVSVAEVCFLCLRVSCSKWLIIKTVMVFYFILYTLFFNFLDLVFKHSFFISTLYKLIFNHINIDFKLGIWQVVLGCKLYFL